MEHSDIEHMAQGYPPAHIAKDSEEVIVWLATQLLATQKQRDALAAENALLLADYRDIPEMRRIGAPLTPATAAYLNSVRERFVDEAIHALAASGAQSFGDCMVALNQLRAGEPS